jgi:hypothetical protein
MAKMQHLQIEISLKLFAVNRQKIIRKLPSIRVIRTTLHFQFYFELKETFEQNKLP